MTLIDTSGTDVVDMLTTDHREMLELLRRIERTEDLDERREIADTVIAEVMRHSVAEEMIVYPSVEEHVPGGKDEVEHDKEEHEELVRVMKDLEGIDVTEGAFLKKVIEFEQLLDHHARDEEDEQFPKLREHIPQDQLIDMGKRVVSAKKVAPTRPHPNAPHSELFHKSVGPGVGMVDRLRDKLTGRES